MLSLIAYLENMYEEGHSLDFRGDLQAVLSLPAYMVGNLNSYAPDDLVMSEIVRITGIQQLVIHNDNDHNYVGNQRQAQYPYVTESYLSTPEQGGGVFFPLGFVLIQQDNHGYLSILRQKVVGKTTSSDDVDDYDGFGIEMAELVGNNLLRVLFPTMESDLQFYRFVQERCKQPHQLRHRKLSQMKELYEKELREMAEKREQRERAEAEKSKAAGRRGTRSSARTTNQRTPEVEDNDDDEVIIVEEHLILGSYSGKDSIEKQRNMQKYQELISSIQTVSGRIPTYSELCCSKQAIDVALSVFGYRLDSEQKAREYFDGATRTRILKEIIQPQFRQWTLMGLHPDKRAWIKSDRLNTYLNNLFSYISLCISVIKEWDFIATSGDERLKHKPDHLNKWKRGCLHWSQDNTQGSRQGRIFFEE